MNKFTQLMLASVSLAALSTAAMADGGAGGNADYGDQVYTQGGAGGTYGTDGSAGSTRNGGGVNTGAGGGGGGAVDASGNGGTGGAGASSGLNTAGPAGGAAGGAASTVSGVTTGGAGGNGHDSNLDGLSASGASGGGGGSAAFIGSAATLNNTSYTGGAGGAGGTGLYSSGGGVVGAGGGGGSGGYGAILSGTSEIDTIVTGGKGGDGGTGAHGGSGGDGGVGVLATGMLTNNGSISGGAGGAAGALSSSSDFLVGSCCTWASSGPGNVNGATGKGGVGLVGSGLNIDNAGSISGGMSGDGLTRADAIDLTGGTTILDMESSSSIIGNINIASGASLALSQAGGTSFLGVITGAGDLLTDTDVTLSGANTYTGTTTAYGYLYLSDAGSIASSSELFISSTFDISGLSGSGTTIQKLNGASSTSVVLGSKALTLGATDGTYAGIISGNGGSLVVDGTVVSLSGANTFTDGVTVQHGTLEVFSSQALGNGGTVALNNLTLLKISGSDTYDHALTLSGATGLELDSIVSGGATWSGLISDGGSAGSLTLFGGGTLTLTNSGNNYTGGTFVSGGSTLVLDQDGEIGTGDLNLGDASSSGTLKLGGSFDLSNFLAIGANGAIIDTNGHDMTVATTINSTGTLEKDGTGTLTLTAPGTVLGGLSVMGGTLEINEGGTLNSGSSVIGIGSQGVLNIGGGGMAGNVISPQINNDGQIVADFTDTSTLSAVLYGEGSLTKEGSGTLILTSDISNYTGGTTINGGSLQLGDGTSTGYISGDVTDNATLAFDAANGSPLTFDGAISGTGGVTIMGGEITLTGTNSYQGGTTISGGTLYVDNASALGDSAGSLAVNGGTLDLYGNSITVGTLTGTGGAIVSSGGSGILTANVASGTTTLATNLEDGSGNLAVTLDATTSGGTVILTGTNTLTGALTMDGGTLQGAGASLNGDHIVLNDATLRASGDANIGALDMYGSGTDTILAAPGATLTATDISFGDHTNANTLIFGSSSDTGTIVFAGMASGSAGTTIEIAGGTARDENGALLAAFENITSFTVDAGATFDVNDGVQQYPSSPGGNLLGSGTVTLGSSASTVLYLSGADFSGTISGAGGLEVQSGTASFFGSNIYTGGTTIDAGATFELTKEGTFVGNVADNGTFQVNEDVPLTLDGVISGNGVFNQTGSSVTTVSGTNSFTGATNVTQGTLNVTGSLAGSNVMVSSGATLSGNGKVGNTTVASGGTMAAAGLTVQGNLTMASGSAYKVPLVAPGVAGNSVTGIATVSGSNLTAILSQTGLYNVQQPISLLTADGGISGSFASMQATGAAANAYFEDFSTDADHVFLTLRYRALTPLLSNATPEEQHVAGAIDHVLVSGGSLGSGPLALFGLSGSALNAGLNQMAGAIGANTAYSISAGFAPFLQLLLTQGGSPAGSQSAANFAPGQGFADAGAPKQAQLDGIPLRVWGRVFGGHVGISADTVTGASGLSSSHYGFAGGLDAQLSDSLLAGLSLGGGQQNFSSGNGVGESGDVMLGAYARQAVADAGYLTASFAYGWHNVTTIRVVNVSGIDVLKAQFSAHEFGGRAEGGYRVGLDDTANLVPFAAIVAESFEAPAYAEHALHGSSSTTLAYAAQSTPITHTELGGRLEERYGLDNGTLSLTGTAAWAHQLSGRALSTVSFQSLAGSSFVSYGVSPARDAAILGLHADVQRQSGLGFGIGIDGLAGSGTTAIEGSGTVSFRW